MIYGVVLFFTFQHSVSYADCKKIVGNMYFSGTCFVVRFSVCACSEYRRVVFFAYSAVFRAFGGLADSIMGSDISCGRCRVYISFFKRSSGAETVSASGGRSAQCVLVLCIFQTEQSDSRFNSVGNNSCVDVRLRGSQFQKRQVRFCVILPENVVVCISVCRCRCDSSVVSFKNCNCAEKREKSRKSRLPEYFALL